MKRIISLILVLVVLCFGALSAIGAEDRYTALPQSQDEQMSQVIPSENIRNIPDGVCGAESHIYDDEYDVDCNICNITREVSITIRRLGDVNGDKKVNVLDATLIQKAMVELISLDGAAALYVDSDGDGRITIRDATAIQKYAANLGMDSDIGAEIKLNVGVQFDLETDNYSDSEAFVIKIIASENNGVLMMTKSEDVNRSDGRQKCCVNFSDGTIAFYKADGSVDKEKELRFPIVPGHEYVVEMIKLDCKYAILRITDMYSMECDEIFCLASVVGRGWGKRTYTYTGDTKDIISAKSCILQDKHTKLLIVGDSYVEGYELSRYGEDTNNRYAMQIKNALDGDCFIYARGGAASGDILIWFDDYLPDKCQPEYTIVSCGGNDTNLYKWKRNYVAIIDKIRAMGSEPILATIGVIPTLSAEIRSVHKEMNDWIMNESGCEYIDVNLATSLDGDRVTLNPEYLLGDGIHPNSAGNDAIFERVLADVPYIFNR